MTRELVVPELEDWVRVFVVSPQRWPDGRLKQWISVGPMYSGGVVGLTAQVGPWKVGVARWEWWK